MKKKINDKVLVDLIMRMISLKENERGQCWSGSERSIRDNHLSQVLLQLFVFVSDRSSFKSLLAALARSGSLTENAFSIKYKSLSRYPCQYTALNLTKPRLLTYRVTGSIPATYGTWLKT